MRTLKKLMINLWVVALMAGAIALLSVTTAHAAEMDVPYVSATGESIPAATYAVTVENGEGGGEYEASKTVTIVADAAPAGRCFCGWTSADGVTFANPTASYTTFEMPANDVTVTATYEYMDAVAMPAFSPSGGTYTEPQSVEISCATEGAEIHYTTDGSEPTADSPSTRARSP